jgi:hypothetical protein
MLIHIIEKAEEKGKLTKVNLKKYKKMILIYFQTKIFSNNLYHSQHQMLSSMAKPQFTLPIVTLYEFSS